MRVARIIAFLTALAASLVSYADSSPNAARDKALQRVNACLRHRSRRCKDLNKNIQTLIDVYKAGDKSVLSVLLPFASTDFDHEVLLSDPDGFLTVMSQLPDKRQTAVAWGIAGGVNVLSEKRFQEIWTLLMAVPESSPNKKMARKCLEMLEANNASLLVKYFPPQKGTNRALGEKPLWPPDFTHDTVYRFTLLAAFNGPAVVTLTVQPDGSGRVAMKSLNNDSDTIGLDKTLTIPHERVAKFLRRLDQTHFWQMPSTIPGGGLDGAEWILEGVQDGNYHVVARWCSDEGRTL